MSAVVIDAGLGSENGDQWSLCPVHEVSKGSESLGGNRVRRGQLNHDPGTHWRR